MKCPKCGNDMPKINTEEMFEYYVCYHDGEFVMSFIDECGG